mmetsp:Transcript_14712/g.35673  ORF Transcript_14712/g.35673 Transcript_14712/m.35673 type:complete len:217 (-) Transcript_14712:220-870(-)
MGRARRVVGARIGGTSSSLRSTRCRQQYVRLRAKQSRSLDPLRRGPNLIGVQLLVTAKHVSSKWCLRRCVHWNRKVAVVGHMIGAPTAGVHPFSMMLGGVVKPRQSLRSVVLGEGPRVQHRRDGVFSRKSQPARGLSHQTRTKPGLPRRQTTMVDGACLLHARLKAGARNPLSALAKLYERPIWITCTRLWRNGVCSMASILLPISGTALDNWSVT